MLNPIKNYSIMIGMKKKHMFLLAFLSMSLLSVPMVLLATTPIMHIGPLPFRTINVDGDPSDWAGITPLVVDDAGDSPPEEDIIAVYGANDENFLYFLMEFSEVGVSAAVPTNENGYTVCRFFIDIIPGGAPSSNDADFRIGFKTHILSIDTQIPADVAVLEYYVPTSWLTSDCAEVQGESMGRFVEVAVAWDCIGEQNCFNCFFTASAQINTDWAPDEDADYVMIGCCPGMPGPVGGEVISSNILSAVAPVLIIVLSVLSVGVLVLNKKHYH
jgi:hypothetical protein